MLAGVPAPLWAPRIPVGLSQFEGETLPTVVGQGLLWDRSRLALVR